MSDPDDRDPWAPPDEETDAGGGRRGPSEPTGQTGPSGLSRPSGQDPGPRTPFGTPRDSSGESSGKLPTPPPGRGLLLLTGVALATLLVWPLVGWTLCAAVVVLAVRARRRAAADRTTAPGTLVALVLAAAGIVVPVLVLGVFYDEITTYQQCSQAANTHQAQDDCDTAFRDGLRRYVEG